MSEKRWVSHGLVDMLIEMRKYDSASEVVSGSEGIFTSLSQRIGEAIARAEKGAADRNFAELKTVLDEAREEILDHQEWQDEVVDRLADLNDDDRGLTRPLRQAFQESATARTTLLDQVMRSCDQYLKAQEGAFTLER